MQKFNFERDYRKLVERYDGDEDLAMDYILRILEGKSHPDYTPAKRSVEEVLMPLEEIDKLYYWSFDGGKRDDILKYTSYLLGKLTDKEEKVIYLYFFKNKTLEEIGRYFDICRERARQILAKALRKLRHPSRSKYLKDFLGEDIKLYSMYDGFYDIITREGFVELSDDYSREVEKEIIEREKKIDEILIQDKIVISLRNNVDDIDIEINKCEPKKIRGKIDISYILDNPEEYIKSIEDFCPYNINKSILDTIEVIKRKEISKTSYKRFLIALDDFKHWRTRYGWSISIKSVILEIANLMFTRTREKEFNKLNHGFIGSIFYVKEKTVPYSRCNYEKEYDFEIYKLSTLLNFDKYINAYEYGYGVGGPRYTRDEDDYLIYLILTEKEYDPKIKSLIDYIRKTFLNGKSLKYWDIFRRELRNQEILYGLYLDCDHKYLDNLYVHNCEEPDMAIGSLVDRTIQFITSKTNRPLYQCIAPETNNSKIMECYYNSMGFINIMEGSFFRYYNIPRDIFIDSLITTQEKVRYVTIANAFIWAKESCGFSFNRNDFNRIANSTQWYFDLDCIVDIIINMKRYTKYYYGMEKHASELIENLLYNI